MKHDLTKKQSEEWLASGYQQWANYRKLLEKAKRMGYETVAEMLRELYVTRNMADIGLLLGISGMTVCNLMRRFGLSTRLPAPQRPEFRLKRKGERNENYR